MMMKMTWDLNWSKTAQGGPSNWQTVMSIMKTRRTWRIQWLRSWSRSAWSSEMRSISNSSRASRQARIWRSILSHLQCLPQSPQHHQINNSRRPLHKAWQLRLRLLEISIRLKQANSTRNSSWKSSRLHPPYNNSLSRNRSSLQQPHRPKKWTPLRQLNLMHRWPRFRNKSLPRSLSCKKCIKRPPWLTSQSSSTQSRSTKTLQQWRKTSL